MLPDKFDDRSSWSDYVIHFESIATVNHWTEDEKAMYLASHLRGGLRRHWPTWPPKSGGICHHPGKL